MRQCIFVIGTRAQLVKVAPVLALATEQKLRHVVWFTGQHDESIDDLLSDFGISSSIDRQPERKEHSSIRRLITWLPGTLLRCRKYISGVKRHTSAAPLVVVHGDTLSTYIGALAARLGGGWTVHLESGLSSGKLLDPFPEELLRRLTFGLTRVALCPNDEAAARMRQYRNCEVIHTGENTLLDCVRLAMKSVDTDAGNESEPYFVASIHRFQNIYKKARLQGIVGDLIALSDISRVIVILHPPTSLRLSKYDLYEKLATAPGIELRQRMPYTEFLQFVAKSRGVVSDGGSNQEELAYLGVPTVLYRSRSERPDGLGRNIVLKDDSDESLRDFARSGKFDALRCESRIHESVQPSQITVDALFNLVQSNETGGGH